MTAHHRDRGAQLVPDVVEELALGLDGALDAVQHPVDGAGQGGQVVPAAHRHAGGQVALVDGVGGPAQLLDGAQQPLHAEPRQRAGQGDRDDGGRRVQAHGAPQLGLRGAQVDRARQGGPLDAVVQRHDQHPVAPGGRLDGLDDRLVRLRQRQQPVHERRVGPEGRPVALGGDPPRPPVDNAELAVEGGQVRALQVRQDDLRGVGQGAARHRVGPAARHLAQFGAGQRQARVDVVVEAAQAQHPHRRPGGEQGDQGDRDDRPRQPGADRGPAERGGGVHPAAASARSGAGALRRGPAWRPMPR